MTTPVETRLTVTKCYPLSVGLLGSVLLGWASSLWPSGFSIVGVISGSNFVLSICYLVTMETAAEWGVTCTGRVAICTLIAYLAAVVPLSMLYLGPTIQSLGDTDHVLTCVILGALISSSASWLLSLRWARATSVGTKRLYALLRPLYVVLVPSTLVFGAFSALVLTGAH